MDNELKKISFSTDNDNIVDFFVLEETRINGVNYLLVTDSDEEEAECHILKDTSGADDEMACYIEVEDDAELDAVLKVFEELLEDVDIVK